MNVTWTISNLDRRTSDGFIQVAHWQCTGVDGDLSSSVYATVGFEEGTPSIPYDQVTEAEVLSWIWANGVDKEATEASIAQRIETLKNPVQASGLPWTPEVQDA
jgi:hypothetical protein